MSSDEDRPPIEERIEELRKEGKSNSEITLILYEEGYPTSEIMAQGLPLRSLKSKDESEPTEVVEPKEVKSEKGPVKKIEPSEELKVPIDDRIKELKEEVIKDNKKISRVEANKKISLTLYYEGYNTGLIFNRFGGALKAALADENKGEQEEEGENEKEISDVKYVGDLGGKTGKDGYRLPLQELVKTSIDTVAVQTGSFTQIGMIVFYAVLNKIPYSLISSSLEKTSKSETKLAGIEELKGLVLDTVRKAIEALDPEHINRVEGERDFARGEYIRLASEMQKLSEQLDPPFRLEKMIHNYILSGAVDPKVLIPMIREWLGMEKPKIDLEAMR